MCINVGKETIFAQGQESGHPPHPPIVKIESSKTCKAKLVLVDHNRIITVAFKHSWYDSLCVESSFEIEKGIWRPAMFAEEEGGTVHPVGAS